MTTEPVSRRTSRRESLSEYAKALGKVDAVSITSAGEAVPLHLAAVRQGLIELGWAPPEEAKNMVDIDRVLAMMGAGATLQELCDWLEELKR